MNTPTPGAADPSPAPRAGQGPSDPAHAPEEAPVSAFVTGDRLCIACGYNLVGQSIVREPHYGLLIARCPECGTVASVQEYPLLGRWAHRWGMLLAAVWVLLIVAGWMATGATLMGLGTAIADSASRPYSNFIGDQFTIAQKQAEQEAVAAKAAEARAAMGTPASDPAGTPDDSEPSEVIVVQRSGGVTVTTYGSSYGGSGFSQWWKQQDHAALLAQAGGWRSGLTTEAVVAAIFSVLFVIIVGWFWAVLLMHLHRRGLVMWGMLVLAAATGLAMFPLGQCYYGQPTWVWGAGWYQLTPRFIIASLLIFAVALFAGLLTGRPIARLAVRLLLPPHLRHALAALWTCDNLQLPRSR